MNETNKAKARIIGLIITRIIIYIIIANYCYQGAVLYITNGGNIWIGALGGLGTLIITDTIMHKILYNRINKYITEKNKGIKIFEINKNTPQWKKELIEGMIKPQQAIFGEKWNKEVFKKW